MNFLKLSFEQVGEVKFIFIGPGSIFGSFFQDSLERVIVQVFASPFRVQARLITQKFKSLSVHDREITVYLDLLTKLHGRLKTDSKASNVG